MNDFHWTTNDVIHWDKEPTEQEMVFLYVLHTSPGQDILIYTSNRLHTKVHYFTLKAHYHHKYYASQF